jgi:peptidoglycan/LPS O-acetylase OafA/YrhL
MSSTIDAPAAPAVAGARPGRLDYLTGLDGIRGLGIIGVLLYHQNVPWMAGVLTVSMFFTLSGFLITRIMVNEWQRTDTLSFSRFYERRVRRLLPASMVVLLAIAVIWTVAPDLSIGKMDFISGLTYWENIHLILADKSYSELFGLASPVQHLWSLSLEEQVYLVFPVLMLVLFRFRPLRRRPIAIAAVLATIAAIGFALGPFWIDRTGNLSRSYYATGVRSAEFLVGALFAVFVECWRWRSGCGRRSRCSIRASSPGRC